MLLSNIKDIPNFFQKYSDVFSRYEQWLISNNISKLEACLNLYYKDERVSKLILGVNSKDQIDQIINTKSYHIRYPGWLHKLDEALVNPQNWQ